MFCYKCGAQLAEGAVFCQKCGTKVVSVDAEQEPQEPKVIPEPNVEDQYSSGTVENTQEAHSSNTTQESGILHKVVGIIPALICGLGLLLLPFSRLPTGAIIFLAVFSIWMIWSFFRRRPPALLKTLQLTIGGIIVILLALYFVPDSNEQLSAGNSQSGNSSQSNVTKQETDIPSELRDTLLFKGIPADQLLGASYDDMIQILGEPDSPMFDTRGYYYGDAAVYFDTRSWGESYISGISSDSLDDFTYNGQPISDNYSELTQMLGREPDEARVFYDTYSMTYTWDHMGATAFLTVDTPATEDSTVATHASITLLDMEDEYTEDDAPPDNSLVLPGGFEWVEEPSGSITSQMGWFNVQITGVIKNTSGKEKSVAQISFNLYDADGYQIGQAKAVIRDLGAGGSWRFTAVGTVTENVSRFEFAGIDGW